MKKMYMKLIVTTLQTRECSQELLFGLLWTFPSLACQIWKLTLQSGLDVTSCKPIRPRGRNSNLEGFTASLCQCIKGYNNRYIKELASLSTEHVASIVAMCRLGIRDPEELTYSPHFGKNVVRVTICKTCSENVVKDFINGLQNIKYTNF